MYPVGPRIIYPGAAGSVVGLSVLLAIFLGWCYWGGYYGSSFWFLVFLFRKGLLIVDFDFLGLVLDRSGSA